jgi:hypothetical protein
MWKGMNYNFSEDRSPEELVIDWHAAADELQVQ